MLWLVLFACFFAGTLIQISIMLGRKRQGMGLDRFRLFFFFMASLMLICLLPLSIFSKLSTAVWVSDLTVVLANLIGLLLTPIAGNAVTARELIRRLRSTAAFGLMLFTFRASQWG